MKIVGLTGGIGAGKTTVSKMFSELGVPVYIADHEAKLLINTSKIIRRKLIDAFGTDTYKDNLYNTSYISSIIFNDKNALQTINSIIHPKVAIHFKKWLKKQIAPYIIKEAAIIFENSMQDQYDLIITVIADKNVRIERILSRENSSRKKILTVMANQLSDDKKTLLSDYVIKNNDLQNTKKQVSIIHQNLIKQCSS